VLPLGLWCCWFFITNTAKLQEEECEAGRQLEAAYKAQQPFLEVLSELQGLATATRIKGTGNLPGVRFRWASSLMLWLLQHSRCSVSTAAAWVEAGHAAVQR
jgi:hypothetical protein